ncbi:MAG: hypothetical protein WAT88_13960, partial [Saprospiraceae bacterium]
GGDRDRGGRDGNSRPHSDNAPSRDSHERPERPAERSERPERPDPIERPQLRPDIENRRDHNPPKSDFPAPKKDEIRPEGLNWED